MAELVDALDSKSGSRKGVWVRFPSRPPLGLGLSLEKKIPTKEILEIKTRQK